MKAKRVLYLIPEDHDEPVRISLLDAHEDEYTWEDVKAVWSGFMIGTEPYIVRASKSAIRFCKASICMEQGLTTEEIVAYRKGEYLKNNLVPSAEGSSTDNDTECCSPQKTQRLLLISLSIALSSLKKLFIRTKN